MIGSSVTASVTGASVVVSTGASVVVSTVASVVVSGVSLPPQAAKDNRSATRTELSVLKISSI